MVIGEGECPGHSACVPMVISRRLCVRLQRRGRCWGGGLTWSLGCTMGVTRSCCRGSSGRVLVQPTRFLSGWLVAGSVAVGWLVMSMWGIRAFRHRGSSGRALARPTGFRLGWFPVVAGWLSLSLRALLPASPTSLCLRTVRELASPETLLSPPGSRGRGMHLRSVACSMREPKLV